MSTIHPQPRQLRNAVRVLPKGVSHWRVDHKEWSQETLARKASQTVVAQANDIKVSPSTIAMIETGKRQPSLLVAQAIAEAFGIGVDAFAFVCPDDTKAEVA